MYWIVLALRVYGAALDSITAVLNDLPPVDASAHAHQSQDSNAASTSHPLLLQTYTPIVTGDDHNCGYNAVSTTLTGSQLFSALICLLCTHSFVKNEPTIINRLVYSYINCPLHAIYHKYCDSLKQAVHLGVWGNDRYLYALSILFNRLRDVQHLAERFRAQEHGSTWHFLYCNNTIA